MFKKQCKTLKLIHVFLLLSAFCLVSVFFSCRTINVSPSVNGEDASSELLDKIDSVIEQFMQRNNIPGLSLAVVQADSVLELRGYVPCAETARGAEFLDRTYRRAYDDT